MQSVVKRLLKEHEVAAILSVSVGTVRRWRLLNAGPRFIRVSTSAVRYRPEDIKAYVEARPSGSGQYPDASFGSNTSNRPRLKPNPREGLNSAVSAQSSDLQNRSEEKS